MNVSGREIIKEEDCGCYTDKTPSPNGRFYFEAIHYCPEHKPKEKRTIDLEGAIRDVDGIMGIIKEDAFGEWEQIKAAWLNET